MRMLPIRSLSLILPACLLLSGCGDDPELVRQSEQQKAEIRQLEGELQLLREKLERAPKDRSEELTAMQESIRNEEGRIADLEANIANLEKERARLEKEFESYKDDYPIR